MVIDGRRAPTKVRERITKLQQSQCLLVDHRRINGLCQCIAFTEERSTRLRVKRIEYVTKPRGLCHFAQSFLSELTHHPPVLVDYLLPAIGTSRIIEIYCAGVLNAKTSTDHIYSPLKAYPVRFIIRMISRSMAPFTTAISSLSAFMENQSLGS